MSSDNTPREVFNMFKEYTEAHFKTLHECDKRIEGKIDELAEQIKASQEKKENRNYDNKMKVVMIFVAAATSMVFTAFLHLFMGG